MVDVIRMCRSTHVLDQVQHNPYKEIGCLFVACLICIQSLSPPPLDVIRAFICSLVAKACFLQIQAMLFSSNWQLMHLLVRPINDDLTELFQFRIGVI